MCIWQWLGRVLAGDGHDYHLMGFYFVSFNSSPGIQSRAGSVAGRFCVPGNHASFLGTSAPNLAGGRCSARFHHSALAGNRDYLQMAAALCFICNTFCSVDFFWLAEVLRFSCFSSFGNSGAGDHRAFLHSHSRTAITG